MYLINLSFHDILCLHMHALTKELHQQYNQEDRTILSK